MCKFLYLLIYSRKLFALLTKTQQKELERFISESKNSESDSVLSPCYPAFYGQYSIPRQSDQPLTEIQEGDLYFCLENRLVYICETEIMLTVKEFDIFALLIMNPRRVLTYDMIIDLVWHESLDYYSHRAINNHVSNLRHKLKVTPETPDYIRSVHSIGYKFNPNIELL